MRSALMVRICGALALKRGQGCGFDLEIKLGGEAHGPQEAQMVLGKAFGGRTDGAKQFRAQIFFATDPVVQLSGDGVEEQAVDGEIAPAGVGLGIGERDVLGMTSVLVIGLGAIGGDLEFMTGFEDNDDAELAANGNSA